jgi:hypothetical protein
MWSLIVIPVVIVAVLVGVWLLLRDTCTASSRPSPRQARPAAAPRRRTASRAITSLLSPQVGQPPPADLR